MAQDDKKNAAPQKAKVLEVSSRPESFCRAGRKWTRTPVQVPLGELTKEQVKALKGEKNLSVTEKEVDAAGAPGGE